jgi:uncharacterized protein YbjT (DUF2867 family)
MARDGRTGQPVSGVLVTGATGKTGGAVVQALRARGVPLRAASRSASGHEPDSVRFAWDDPASHASALRGLDRVYLVPPPSALDPLPLVEPFLDEARRSGVRRLVLLGSAIVFPGAPGRLELEARVRQEPGWVVLRPSGFMQNFLPPHPVGQGIQSRGEIRTSAGDGRAGWIDVLDVADAAATLLGAPGLDAADDYLLTGADALSYTDAASIITTVSGRAVQVRQSDVAEVAAGYQAAGLPPSFAASLASTETAMRAGDNAWITTTVSDLTGHPVRSFADFVRRNASHWVSAAEPHSSSHSDLRGR